VIEEESGPLEDWFDWLRDDINGIGMTAEEEAVIRANFPLIRFLVYFLMLVLIFWSFSFFSAFNYIFLFRFCFIFCFLLVCF
jgi:hypothetical protein